MVARLALGERPYWFVAKGGSTAMLHEFLLHVATHSGNDKCPPYLECLCFTLWLEVPAAV